MYRDASSRLSGTWRHLSRLSRAAHPMSRLPWLSHLGAMRSKPPLRQNSPAAPERRGHLSPASPRASSWPLQTCLPSLDRRTPNSRAPASATRCDAPFQPMSPCQKVTAMTTDVTVFRAFEATVDRLQAMHAAVLLRPREFSVQAAFRGDYDFLFDPDRFTEIVAAAVTQSRQYGVSLTIEQYAQYKKRICFICDNPERRIQIELWPHAELTISSGPFRSLATIGWNSARPFFVDSGRYLALGPTIAAAVYLTHLHHKQKSLSSPEVQGRLAYYADALSRSDNELDKDLLGAVQALRARAADLKIANTHACSTLARMGVQVRTLRMAPLLERGRRRLASVVVGRNGMPFSPVPVIGPDGSGKTTIVNSLAEQHGFSTLRFKNVFRFSLLYRGYHRLKERYAHTSHKAKNLVDENMAQIILMIAVVRWWPVIAWRTGSRYLRGRGRSAIVVDRYFWDYLVRVRRPDVPPSRISGYHLLSRLMPAPSRAVVLCCGLETLYSRKNELSPEAVEYLYGLYCDQIARNRVKRVLALSTDGPLDRSCRQVAWFLRPDRASMSRRSLVQRLIGVQRRGEAAQWAEAGQQAFGGHDGTHSA